MASREEAIKELARRELAKRQQQGERPAASSIASNMPFAGALNAATEGVYDALTFGFGDEISAAAQAPITTLAGLFRGKPVGLLDAYERNLRGNVRDMADSKRAFPAATTAGNVAGALVGAKAVAPAMASTRAAIRGAPLAARAGIGAAEGATGGALYGAGSANNEGRSRMEGAVLNGLLGAGIGAAMPAVGSAVSSTVDGILNSRNGRRIAQGTGFSADVLRNLGRITGGDQTFGEEGMERMARAGPQAMIADAGPTAQGVLDTAIQRGGEGARIAQGRITDRLNTTSAGFNNALDETLGVPGVSPSREIIVYGDKTTPTSLAYKSAYANPIDYTSPQGMEIEDIVKSRVPGRAISAANELMRVEGNASQQIKANLDEAGNVLGFEVMPDTRQLDYITRGLNSVAEAENGKGALGGTTSIGRAYGNLSRDIRNRIKEINPQYARALNLAGTEIGKRNAKEFGGTALRPSISRDEVSEFVKDMPAVELGYLKNGVRQSIDDHVANAKMAMSDPNMDARETMAALKQLNTRSSREKIETILGKSEATKLFGPMEEAISAFNIRASVAQNSKTYARQATQEAVSNMTDAGIVGQLARGEPLQAGKRLVQYGTGQTPARLQAQEDEMYAQLADLLTRRGQDAKSAAIATRAMGIEDDYTKMIVNNLRAAISQAGLYSPVFQAIEE